MMDEHMSDEERAPEMGDTPEMAPQMGDTPEMTPQMGDTPEMKEHESITERLEHLVHRKPK
jgi:hypothetical protein